MVAAIIGGYEIKQRGFVSLNYCILMTYKWKHIKSKNFKEENRSYTLHLRRVSYLSLRYIITYPQDIAWDVDRYIYW